MKRVKLVNRFTKFVIVMVSIATVLTIFGSQASFAQVVRKKPPVVKIEKKPVFKGTGIIAKILKSRT